MVRGRLLPAALPHPCPEGADAEPAEEQPSDEPGPEGMAHEEARDEAETEGAHGAVEAVRYGGAETRDQAQGATLRERATYDEHPDGAHRGGDGEAAYEEFHDHVPILQSPETKNRQGSGGFLKSARERAHAG